MSTSSAGVTTSNKVGFSTTFYDKYDIDNIRLVGDSLSSTTTFTHTDANELATMTLPDGSVIDFEFDAWGRMTRKALDTAYETTYAYKYGQTLTEVESNFPGEGNVTYDYGANVQRRSRTAGGTTMKYRWLGYRPINEENGSGTLTRTEFFGLASVTGTNPATGDYTNNSHDHLCSVRVGRDQLKAKSSSHEFSGFGQLASQEGKRTPEQFAMLHSDPESKLWFAPARYYSSKTGKWLTREPFGFDGLNAYAYVLNNPANGVDPTGLWTVRVLGGAVFGGFELEVGFNSGQFHMNAGLGAGAGGLLVVDPSNKPANLAACNGASFDTGFTGQGGAGLGLGAVGVARGSAMASFGTNGIQTRASGTGLLGLNFPGPGGMPVGPRIGLEVSETQFTPWGSGGQTQTYSTARIPNSFAFGGGTFLGPKIGFTAGGCK